MQVTVVGAGVIGLVTARLLVEHGHDVRVVAAETGERTTSAVAAAVWFPYRVGPRERVLAWAQTTRAWLERLPHAAGVDPLIGYEIADDELAPWWSAGLDVERTRAPVRGAPPAWKYRAPRVEPAVFLPWIADGLRIEHRRVDDLEAEPGDVVVNCTGLAARTLAADPALAPLFGQVVITELGDYDPTVTITDERDPDAMFYAIPRRTELVLGGCALPRDVAEIDPAITERIVTHARSLGLQFGAIQRARAGLRPYRDAVRLERTGRIVHNYGHGGAGYTLCRGCAEDVARLVLG